MDELNHFNDFKDFKFNTPLQMSGDEVMMIPKQKVGAFDEGKIIRTVFSAIALNPKLDFHINKKFSSKSAKYTNAAYSHEWYPLIVHSTCLADQIERGIKVLGIWAVEGTKALDDLLKQGWSKAWRILELARKNDELRLIEMIIFDLAQDQNTFYSDKFMADIILYYLYFHGFKDWPFPLNPNENPLINEALFFAQGKGKPNKKNFDPAVSEFYQLSDLDGEFRNLQELDRQIRELSGDEIMFNTMSISMAGLNPFCLMTHGLTKLEADTIAANGYLTIGPEHEYSDSLYYDNYLITILCKEYDALKEKYFSAIKKNKAKYASHDEKQARKELKKAQARIEKLESETEQLRGNLQKTENLKRKIEAERDSEIAKAVKKQEKAFRMKEKAYQDRIAMLEEMLADRTEETAEPASEENFDEMLALIKNTSGILYVCNNETGAATTKMRRLKELADNIKFFTSENDPVPSEISYIFFDYHLISHGVYYKIKNIGKRCGIPIYNIQNLKADDNILEMGQVISKEKQVN